MKTTIDQQMQGGYVRHYDVVTDDTMYPDSQSALDAHQAQVELHSLAPDVRMIAYDLLCYDLACYEECDPENEAAVIRRAIADALNSK